MGDVDVGRRGGGGGGRVVGGGDEESATTGGLDASDGGEGAGLRVRLPFDVTSR